MLTIRLLLLFHYCVTALLQAAERDNVEVIRWARELGCRWSVTSVAETGMLCITVTTLLLALLLLLQLLLLSPALTQLLLLLAKITATTTITALPALL